MGKKAGPRALFLAAVAAFGQSAPPAVIRTETRLVLVDAVVRDKKSGKIASGLTARDFRLFEDGREQPIRGVSVEAGASSDRSPPQYLLFLFDSSAIPAAERIATEAEIRKDVAEFAAAYAGPDLYMAVVNFNGNLWVAQNFTTAADRIQRAAADTAHITDGSGEAYVLQRLQPSGLVSDASIGYYQSDAIRMSAANMAGAMARESRPLPVADAIRDIVSSMAAIRGRKSLVVLSGARTPAGGEPPPAQGAATALDCNRANVAVYSTNAGLKTLAESTGGRSISNNLVRELSGVIDDEERRYILAFKPVESPEGSCHTLRVQTVRGGLQARARTAYCNVKPPDLLAGKVEGKAMEARADGPSAGNAAASMELPYFYDSPGIALVDLAMEMDLAHLAFAKKDGKQHAELNLAAVAYGSDGEVAGRFSDAVALDFETAGQVEAFRKRPYRYERQFRLAYGRYNVRVAFGSGGRNLGRVESPLAIDAWDGRRLTLSAIALSAEARKVSDLTSDLDQSLLEGHKRLVANSVEISGSGSNRFHRAAPCFAYLEVYDPPPAASDALAFHLEIRILDRTGAVKEAGTLAAADSVRPGSPAVPVRFDVPIASLGPGVYVLEVKAVRPGSDSAVRTAEFQVEE